MLRLAMPLKRHYGVSKLAPQESDGHAMAAVAVEHARREEEKRTADMHSLEQEAGGQIKKAEGTDSRVHQCFSLQS